MTGADLALKKVPPRPLYVDPYVPQPHDNDMSHVTHFLQSVSTMDHAERDEESDEEYDAFLRFLRSPPPPPPRTASDESEGAASEAAAENSRAPSPSDVVEGGGGTSGRDDGGGGAPASAGERRNT